VALIGGTLAYRILKRIDAGQASADQERGAGSATRSKLDVAFGPAFWNEIPGKTVIDFGCGTGSEAVEMARRGARKVIGLDTRESVLEVGRDSAARAGVSDRCEFTARIAEKADVIVSLDAFEHFADPAGVLRTMRHAVRDDGCALVAFGPTWYHPLGGHLFSVFPWAHLVFSEEALIRWRSDFKTDGATRFGEVEGGLNQMTIRRFERLVAASEWSMEQLQLIPIRRLRLLANPVTRELFTSLVTCRLQPILERNG
jgi:SAM-dependent methyltransferase